MIFFSIHDLASHVMLSLTSKHLYHNVYSPEVWKSILRQAGFGMPLAYPGLQWRRVAYLLYHDARVLQTDLANDHLPRWLDTDSEFCCAQPGDGRR